MISKTQPITSNDSVIVYTLTRSTRRKKTISIAISGQNGVVVRAPKRVSMDEIDQVIKSKADWIKRRFDEAKKLNRLATKKYVAGERFKLLGHDFPLVIEEARIKRERPARLERGCLIATVPFNLSEEDRATWIKGSLRRCFHLIAQKNIGRIVARVSEQIGIEPGAVRIKNLTRSWGVCTGNNISFNWRLTMAPPRVVEYVVAHELCHLCHKNHSRAFWSMLEFNMPDYEFRKKELRSLGPYLDLR